MSLQKWWIGLLAGALLTPGSFAVGDNGPFNGSSFGGPPPQPSLPQQPQQNWPYPQQSAPYPQQNRQPPQAYPPPPAPNRSDWPPAADQRPIQPFAPAAYQSPVPPVSNQQVRVAAPGQPLSAQPPQGVLPPPPVRPEGIPAGQPVNGTWRDERDCIVIEVNGQQLRLAKPAPTQPQVGGPPMQVPTGSVHGRLFQGSRPLADCIVVIVPMHNDGTNDENGIRQPLKAATDADGVYGFENVPVGPYKMTWLPAGTEQWIRRIEMKPDVFVHEGQGATLKDIRWAQRTIN